MATRRVRTSRVDFRYQLRSSFAIPTQGQLLGCLAFFLLLIASVEAVYTGNRFAAIQASGAPQKSRKPDIVVALDGTGDYKTVQEALDNASSGRRGRFTIIYIKAGVYNETPTTPKSLHHVALVGEKGGGGVTITAAHYAGEDDAEVAMNTEESSTFKLWATDFLVQHITFENSHGPGKKGGKEDQAVALMVKGTRIQFYECTFLGYQDTLYAHSGLQYYKNCIIQGRMDFVFGNAKAVFDDCIFRLVYWGGAYFAQARAAGDETGFVIRGGVLTPYGSEGPIRPGYLARSWGDYSTVVFANTFFAKDAVREEGWGFVSG
ncbi:unnamed protein product [Closterium sp. Yama58-4]|nr:unnamed protein product [Closterium sp. Yama58-4]